jgi:hypothetical protein
MKYMFLRIFKVLTYVKVNIQALNHLVFIFFLQKKLFKIYTIATP